MEPNDITGILVTGLWVVFFIIISEGLARTGKISKETSRMIMNQLLSFLHLMQIEESLLFTSSLSLLSLQLNPLL